MIIRVQYGVQICIILRNYLIDKHKNEIVYVDQQ